MNKLDNILNKLEKLYNPVSIFLYGSRARNDFLERSDHEIGVLFLKNKYVKRNVIQNSIRKKGINIYPFEHENFVRLKVDTPFQKSIYLREVILGGKTLRGAKVIETMKPPQIKTLDLIQRIRFDLGFALASLMSFRNKDLKTSSIEFYKSCLFGVRCFEILKLKKFPLSYNEIYRYAKKLKLGEYSKLVSDAHELRLGKNKLKEENIFKNISFLNEYIEPEIIKYYNKKGNQIILK